MSNEKLVEALRFYATDANWRSASNGFALQYDPEPAPLLKDRGARAKEALAAHEAELSHKGVEAGFWVSVRRSEFIEFRELIRQMPRSAITDEATRRLYDMLAAPPASSTEERNIE